MSVDVIQNFNKELKTLLDHRPPVSRQKMSLITKAAIKGIKFYKHIVQSIEKFIQKCSVDFKVPGLYVIDAVIRQSRHQYGNDRDVFAPRFLKNIVQTFQHLYKCDEKDRPLIIRVLNLWQKNEIFPPTIIQSLLDMAPDPDNPETVATALQHLQPMLETQSTQHKKPKAPRHSHHSSSSHPDAQFPPTQQEEMLSGGVDRDERFASMPQGGLISSVAELLQRFQGSDDVRLQISQLQLLQQQILEQSTLLNQEQMIDPEILAQLQTLMEELTRTARTAIQKEHEARLAKNVIAYDYEDDSDDENKGGASSIDPSFLQQLEQMTETLAQTRALQEELLLAREQQRRQNEPSQPHLPIDIDLRKPPPQHQHHHQRQHHSNVVESFEEGEIVDTSQLQVPEPPPMHEEQQIMRSRSPPPKKRHKDRSRSPVRRRNESPDRQREKDRQRAERNKERRRRALPPLRDRQLSVVSTTLFVGKIHKATTETKLRELLEEFGPVDELLLIGSRGCAFVIYDKRKHAARALEKLQNARLDGSSLRVAWAPNRGIKDTSYKEFWDEDLGCSYVPYDRFPRDASWRNLLSGGAFIDADTVPVELAELINQPEDEESPEAKPNPASTLVPPPPNMPMPAFPPMMPPPMAFPLFNPMMMAAAAAMSQAPRMIPPPPFFPQQQLPSVSAPQMMPPVFSQAPTSLSQIPSISFPQPQASIAQAVPSSASVVSQPSVGLSQMAPSSVASNFPVPSSSGFNIPLGFSQPPPSMVPSHPQQVPQRDLESSVHEDLPDEAVPDSAESPFHNGDDYDYSEEPGEMDEGDYQHEGSDNIPSLMNMPLRPMQQFRGPRPIGIGAFPPRPRFSQRNPHAFGNQPPPFRGGGNLRGPGRGPWRGSPMRGSKNWRGPPQSE